MAIKILKTRKLGSGVSSYEFEVRKDDVKDAEIYRRGRELEISVSDTLKMRDGVQVLVKRAKTQLELGIEPESTSKK